MESGDLDLDPARRGEADAVSSGTRPEQLQLQLQLQHLHLHLHLHLTNGIKDRAVRVLHSNANANAYA